MAHYAAVHKATGEVMWTQNPHALGPEWDCKRISRAPTEFDDFDVEAGRLKQNKARKDKAARSVVPFEARLATLEDQVAALLARLPPEQK